jgi:hypothetical protein
MRDIGLRRIEPTRISVRFEEQEGPPIYLLDKRFFFKPKERKWTKPVEVIKYSQIFPFNPLFRTKTEKKKKKEKKKRRSLDITFPVQYLVD